MPPLRNRIPDQTNSAIANHAAVTASNGVNIGLVVAKLVIAAISNATPFEVASSCEHIPLVIWQCVCPLQVSVLGKTARVPE